MVTGSALGGCNLPDERINWTAAEKDGDGDRATCCEASIRFKNDCGLAQERRDSGLLLRDTGTAFHLLVEEEGGIRAHTMEVARTTVFEPEAQEKLQWSTAR